jgi:hypothetical protein
MVEVKGSYRAAIIATCQHFGVKVSNEDIRLGQFRVHLLFSAVNIVHNARSAFKARGNANNDWDVSLSLIKDSGSLASEKIPTREDVILVFEELYVSDAQSIAMSWRAARVCCSKFAAVITEPLPRRASSSTRKPF